MLQLPPKPENCGWAALSLPSPSAPSLTLPNVTDASKQPSALMLPPLPKPLRVPLTPVDRSTARWLDCLFWLSAKNGGGYIRVEDVDHLVRSNADLPPLQQRGTSSRMKRNMMTRLNLPPLPTATCPSDGYANVAVSTVRLPSSVSAAALTLPPIPSN